MLLRILSANTVCTNINTSLETPETPLLPINVSQYQAWFADIILLLSDIICCWLSVAAWSEVSVL